MERAFGNVSYGSMNRMDPDGSNVEPYASGVPLDPCLAVTS